MLCIIFREFLLICQIFHVHYINYINIMHVITCDDGCPAAATEEGFTKIYSQCIQIKQPEPSCVFHLIIKVQKSQVKSPFVECCTLQPPTPNRSASRQSSFKLTTPNMLPLTWSATGSSACTWPITKRHSSPVHVNETQAPLWSSKALLSADGYHFPLASERVMARHYFTRPLSLSLPFEMKCSESDF